MTTSEQRPTAQARRTNQLAIGALVCGIVGVWLFPAGIVAIVLSRKARRQILGLASGPVPGGPPPIPGSP